MRAAILARFSTDRQRDSSCDDQIAVCRPRAERDGWSVVAEYRDERTSGSTLVANRIGGAKMLADALADRFDVLLLEGLDRLARDLVEQETIVRRLEHRGIRIIGVTDGYDSALAHGRKVQRLARGIVNEIYLDDVRRETHRGKTRLASSTIRQVVDVLLYVTPIQLDQLREVVHNLAEIPGLPLDKSRGRGYPDLLHAHLYPPFYDLRLSWSLLPSVASIGDST